MTTVRCISPSARVRRIAVACLLASGWSVADANEFDRLAGLLAATPQGGWVKASIGTFPEAWATGSTAVNLPSYSNPASIVTAWSSFAWDATRGDLLLWGGGHANYAGNEMYVWDGASGNWSRGSLASRLDANYYVVDNAAPQSAHTYDNNIYLKNNGMFLTFGGAAFQSGGNLSSASGRTGPWLWDPSKADPNKVGGTTGSGYDPSSLGGQMWTNRQGQWTGSEGPSYVNSTTAYRSENGKDVVYLTSDSNASGFPTLYRYTLGNVRQGGSDSWEAIGRMWYSAGYQGTATLDSANNYYVRTVNSNTAADYDLTLWDLGLATPGNPDANKDRPIRLVYGDGTDFSVNSFMAVEYDAANGQFLIWDGKEQGTVYSTHVMRDAQGQLLTTWEVVKRASSTAAQPEGNFVTGVLGKWQYSAELGAFIALDEFRNNDASVWLYKPFDLTVPVPEASSWAMMLAGLAGLALMQRRRHA